MFYTVLRVALMPFIIISVIVYLKPVKFKPNAYLTFTNLLFSLVAN